MDKCVQIKIFRYSLEGIAWYRTLPVASINSLTSFHAAFNFFCKEYFSTECPYEKCCDGFDLLCKDFSCHGKHACDEKFSTE